LSPRPVPVRGAASVEAPDLVSPERAEIEGALGAADGVVARAAEALGLTRQAMYRRMARVGVRLERRVKGGAAR
jgi:transcriptional regulator with GAF, ATPase, and Fis domain